VLTRRCAGLELTDEVFDRADTMSVLAVNMRVMALEDVLSTKLATLDEHALDYSSLRPGWQRREHRRPRRPRRAGTALPTNGSGDRLHHWFSGWQAQR
jgi:hypothetical protein